MAEVVPGPPARRVLLLVPPYHALTSPALSVSLLKAILQRRGVMSDVRYLNLKLGALTGVDLYNLLSSNARTLVGDWLFAADLFGERAVPPETFVQDVLIGQLGLNTETVEQIERVRAAIPSFLDRAHAEVPTDHYDIVVTCADLAVGEDRIQNCAALAFLQRLKARQPSIQVVMGGANCQGPLGSAIHRTFPFVDYVCAGEGERALPTLIERLLHGESGDGLPGIIGRYEVARPDVRSATATVTAPLVLNLDALPYPDFDDYFGQFAAYREAAVAASSAPEGGADGLTPILVFETSRGCWWGEKHHCTFCGLNGEGMPYRAKSAPRALDELDYLVSRHGVRRIFASDMILNPRYFDSFLSSLAERPWPPSLFFETKANLTREQLVTLARAGVRELQPGLESLSTPTLRLMDKGVTALQNIRLLKWCAEVGIQPFWNILFGFGGEDPAEYARMAALVPSLTHLPPPYRVIQIRMDRFSPNFDRAEALGFANVRPAEAYRYVYPLTDEYLSDLAFYFDYDYADARDPESYTAGLRDAIDGWRAHADGAALTLQGSGDSLLVEDSRPDFGPSTVTLDGPAALAYRALDAGATVAEVVARLAADECAPTVAARQVEGWLDDWLAAGFVYREGARYLSLAVDPSRRVPLPAERLMARLSGSRR